MADAMTLYDWLIRPVEGALTACCVDTLVVVPDGPLRLIPFSALSDGRRYLIERWAVGVVPSLRLTDVRVDGEEAAREPKALLNGLSEASGGFAPLAHVPGELSGIQEMLGGKILLNEAFTRSALKRELQNRTYDIVHMATHAVFGDSAEGSFLLTYDGRLTMDQLDGLIRAGEAQGRRLDLLTLSACETALGDERAAFGLAGVALKAGAGSALATLWQSDVEAAARVVDAFYRHLVSPGVSKASALQRAQLEVMADPRFRRPGAWASFLVVGDWR
jgi:CHAT domain-containing protein